MTLTDARSKSKANLFELCLARRRKTAKSTPPSGQASLQTTDADNNLLQDSLTLVENRLHLSRSAFGRFHSVEEKELKQASLHSVRTIIVTSLKRKKVMKKIILGLTVLMSIVGTGTSFGSTKQNVKNSPKQEVVCNQKNSIKCECKICKDLEKKQQQKKVDTKKHKTTCNCSNCKKQNTKKQVVKQPVKQAPTLYQTTKK